MCAESCSESCVELRAEFCLEFAWDAFVLWRGVPGWRLYSLLEPLASSAPRRMTCAGLRLPRRRYPISGFRLPNSNLRPSNSDLRLPNSDLRLPNSVFRIGLWGASCWNDVGFLAASRRGPSGEPFIPIWRFWRPPAPRGLLTGLGVFSAPRSALRASLEVFVSRRLASDVASRVSNSPGSGPP